MLFHETYFKKPKWICINCFAWFKLACLDKNEIQLWNSVIFGNEAPTRNLFFLLLNKMFMFSWLLCWNLFCFTCFVLCWELFFLFEFFSLNILFLCPRDEWRLWRCSEASESFIFVVVFFLCVCVVYSFFSLSFPLSFHLLPLNPPPLAAHIH